MKVVSLFSGAGGLDLGFKMAGHDIIWANDMYADAVETYKKNNEYDVEIPSDDLAELNTVGDVINYLKDKGVED